MHQTDPDTRTARPADSPPPWPLSDVAGLFALPGLSLGEHIEWLIDRVLTDRSDAR